MRQVHVIARRLSVAAIVLAAALPAVATVPAPDPGQPSAAAYELWLQGGPDTSREVPPYLGPFNYLREFVQMTDFFARWQVSDPDSSDYGGMIEAESGYLGDVIQTDNTLEAIWCWSRYREFSGRDTYDENVAAAWVYCERYPAWEEEGAAGDDYYRAHNSAWGLTAVLRYKAATGDDSYDRYAGSCAQFIVDHPLDLGQGDVYHQRLNAFVKGWCAGNLYLFGEATDNQILMDAAVAQGEDVLDWLNTSPRYYLGYEYWAMSSGTSLWGVCNSVFRADPAAGQVWLAANAEHLDVWQDYYTVPGYVWDSAWNVAYANAHFAVWDVTGDQTFWDNGVYVTGNLLSYDTDDDGGIVATSTDPVTEDMSWVSCYLVKFGVDRLMGEPLAHDTGMLRFLDLEDGMEFESGETIPLRVVATNYGLNDETSVTVTFTGAGDEITTTVDLDFARQDTLILAADWLPPQSGDLVLTVRTDLPGDEDPANDAVSVAISVDGTTGVGDRTHVAFAPEPTLNPFHAATGLRFELARRADVTVGIYDLRGRRIAELRGADLPAGPHTLHWNGHDTKGRLVPAGVYLYRARAGAETVSGKLMRIR